MGSGVGLGERREGVKEIEGMGDDLALPGRRVKGVVRAVDGAEVEG
jgi:hypothetical protein